MNFCFICHYNKFKDYIRIWCSKFEINLFILSSTNNYESLPSLCSFFPSFLPFIVPKADSLAYTLLFYVYSIVTAMFEFNWPFKLSSILKYHTFHFFKLFLNLIPHTIHPNWSFPLVCPLLSNPLPTLLSSRSLLLHFCWEKRKPPRDFSWTWHNKIQYD